MEFLEIVIDHTVPAIATAVGVVLAVYVRKGINYVSRKLDLNEKKELADAVVRFTEQVYSSVDGEEKFRIAKRRLADIAEERNLPFGKKEIETFIEESVRAFKDEFGEDWVPGAEED